jgi:NADP-dependent 3-hydroxy acid dehydrogenase YdfG
MTYIITGVSGALAGGLARKLLNDGKRVIGLSRRNPNIEKLEFYEMDLTDENKIEKVIKKIFSILDNEPIYLVNVAGVFAGDIRKGEIERVYRANIMGEIFLTEGLLSKIEQTGGDILNVSSTAGTKGVSAEPIYSSSKWAVRGFTKSLQERLKSSKVRVTDFAIGGFVSDFAKKTNGLGFDASGVVKSEWIPEEDAVNLIYTVINIPKTIQITEIIADRKGIK